MENLIKLQRFIYSIAWFSGKIELNINLKNEFEGFYGKASEDWEKQVIINLISPDDRKCPNIKIIGRRFEDIDKVCGRVLKRIEEWKYIESCKHNE